MRSMGRFTFSLGNVLLAMVPLAVVFAGLIAPHSSTNLSHVTAIVIGGASACGALVHGGSGLFFGFVLGAWIMGVLLALGVVAVH